MGFRRSWSWRGVEPHQVIYFEGPRYMVTWCRFKEGWRCVRTDRVLDASPDVGSFAPRADHHDIGTPAPREGSAHERE